MVGLLDKNIYLKVGWKSSCSFYLCIFADCLELRSVFLLSELYLFNLSFNHCLLN